MRATPVWILTIAVGVGGLVLAAVTGQFVFVVLALVPFLLFATRFSGAGRLATPLQQFVGSRVNVHAWGAPLPANSVDSLRLESVRAISAGLHLYFRTDETAESMHLKVAQPGDVLIEPDRVVIGKARYLQWAGKRLTYVPNTTAVTIARE